MYKLSENLTEDIDILRDIYKGGATLDDSTINDLITDLRNARKIVELLEIRANSLNNLRNEVNRYMDELNSLLG